MRGDGGGGGETEHGKAFHPLLNTPAGGGSVVAGVLSPELSPEDAIIEKTLLSIQEKVCHQFHLAAVCVHVLYMYVD